MCAVETEAEIARLNNLAWLIARTRDRGWPIEDATNEAIRRFGRRLSGLTAQELEEITREWVNDEENDD